MSIPKIIHQIWIGPKTPPTKFMDTWKNIHKDEGFEYIRWTEEELKKRNFISNLTDKINDMQEINGKADILRWELLYEYGGFFVDADAYCIKSVSYLLKKYKAFVGYENEIVRCAGWIKNNNEYDDVLARTHPLIATGTMAFPPKHELPRLAIEWIKNNDINIIRTGKRAWRTVGPGLLTRLFFQNKWSDITVLPSYYFLPIHASNQTYIGHGVVYANQEWGSTKESYDTMNDIGLPDVVKVPKRSVSVLIPCYNINASYFSETLESIKQQQGRIFINLVCINDGSDDFNTTILERLLDNFKKNVRWIKVHYYVNKKNMGIGPTLRKGVILCPDELILRMDSDDIMHPERIIKQVEFMDNNKDCALCGSQIYLFKNNLKQIHSKTSHPNYTWNEYIKMKVKPHWLMNHPTFCFRKSKILEVGNYEENIRSMYEDFYLVLKVMKKYGKIYNMKECLLFYRLHENQLTHNGGKEGGNYWNKVRNDAIEYLINS